jgi:hypothetical protein
MITNLNKVVEEANNILKLMLTNTCVESFGLLHQLYFIEFRNEKGEDILLTMDSEVNIFPNLTIKGLDEDEYKLLCLKRLNLLKVIEVNCNFNSDLEFCFEGNLTFKILGSPEDKSITEPWQVTDKKVLEEGGRLIIALNGNGYAIW